MYNVLEKLRAEEPLTAKEKTIHQQDLVTILKQLHDDLDAAVFDAYGWPHDLSDNDILQRLVDRNAQRAAEEAAGHIRWLRPEYQAPEAPAPEQATFQEGEPTPEAHPAPVEKQKWPKELKDRASAIRTVIGAGNAPADVNDIAAAFQGKRTQKRLSEVGEILEMLAELGPIRRVGEQSDGAG